MSRGRQRKRRRKPDPGVIAKGSRSMVVWMLGAALLLAGVYVLLYWLTPGAGSSDTPAAVDSMAHGSPGPLAPP